MQRKKELEERNRDRIEKKNQKDEEKRQKEEEKMRKREELALEWSKKERAELCKAVSSYGIARRVGDKKDPWRQIQQRAQLNKKPPDVIKKHYEEIIANYRRVIKTGQATLVADDVDERKDCIKDDPAANSLANAQKLLQRVQLSSMIRLKILPRAELAAVLTKKLSRHKFGGLPENWTVQHDIALMQGIDKYGMAQLDSMRNDPKLPFVLSIEKHDDTSTDAAVMRVELPREKVAISPTKP